MWWVQSFSFWPSVDLAEVPNNSVALVKLASVCEGINWELAIFVSSNGLSHSISYNRGLLVVKVNSSVVENHSHLAASSVKLKVFQLWPSVRSWRKVLFI